MRGLSRRRVLQMTGAVGIAGLAGCVGDDGGASDGGADDDVFRAGALFALSGSEEVIGRPMMNSTELAVQQINNNGGIGGREIELIQADNASDPQTGIEESRRLINQERVNIVFGAYTSAMRNAITDTYVQNEVPLFYPTLYEGAVCTTVPGQEDDDINIPAENLEWLFINGAVPRQQIEPYIPWLMEEYDVESFYLVGSDYVWPHTTNAILSSFVEDNGGEIVAEDYVPLGFTDWGAELSDIADEDPDIVYHTVVGESMVAMIQQADDLGLTDDTVWASNVQSEQESLAAGDAADGFLTSAPYFTSLDTPENDTYISGYEAEFGTDTTPNFVAESAYWSVLMTAEGLNEYNPDAASGPEVKEALENPIEIDAPQGAVEMDPGTHHTIQQSRVGEFNADTGEYEVLEDFGQIHPAGITVVGDCLVD